MNCLCECALLSVCYAVLLCIWIHCCYQQTQYDAIRSQRRRCVTLLADPIRAQSVSMYSLLYERVCKCAEIV